MLTGALKSLFAVAEAYPDLKANENFLALQEELTGTEGRISYARQFYNDAVLQLNTKIQSFPSNILADMFGFKEQEYFEADDTSRGPVIGPVLTRRRQPVARPVRPDLLQQAAVGPAGGRLRAAGHGRRLGRRPAARLRRGRAAGRPGRRRHRVGAGLVEVRRGGPGHEPRPPDRRPRPTPRLHNLVEGLCIAAGLPKPRVYVIDDPAPNAFATGRNPQHAAIAVTTGLMDKLNRIELEGVLAHELSHIKNYDILVSTLAVTFVGVIALLADFSLRFLWWGGPRHRDDTSVGRRRARPPSSPCSASSSSCSPPWWPGSCSSPSAAGGRRWPTSAASSLTRYPPGLISALEKLKDDTTVVHSSSRATAHLWIESPLARTQEEGRLAWLNRLFDTHPPLEERIQALKEL